MGIYCLPLYLQNCCRMKAECEGSFVFTNCFQKLVCGLAEIEVQLRFLATRLGIRKQLGKILNRLSPSVYTNMF